MRCLLFYYIALLFFHFSRHWDWIRRHCLKFLCLNLSPPVRMMRALSLLLFALLLFRFSFLTSRSRSLLGFLLFPFTHWGSPAFLSHGGGVNVGIFVTKNKNVLLEISVSSFSLLLFTWCEWFFVSVLCFTYLDLLFLGFLLLLLPPFGFPRLSHRIIWGECGNVYCSSCSLSYISLNIICIQSKRKGKNQWI